MSEIPVQRMMRGQNNNAMLFLLQRPQLRSRAAVYSNFWIRCHFIFLIISNT